MNYNKEFERIVLENSRAKLLLHCCCAVCAAFCFEKFRGLGAENVRGYFYNPNIMPMGEYRKRAGEMLKLGFREEGIVICEYVHQEFLEEIKGCENYAEGGERCEKCFYLRLKKTAEEAKKMNYDFFATTLTISPHKNSKIINKIGFEIENEIGVKYLPSDFKKGDGYKRSLEIAKELILYRQNYCGCKFD
ncbi:MAG: epoxyqueuosine reductase QueH [Defluviitaleaceae bacterium]|nr:epoxyqueuosine reductase QueH [Defluviitaleaceae bacterium]